MRKPKVFKKVRISVNKEAVKDLIERSGNVISKKDLGNIFNRVLSQPEKLENEVKEYIEHKYDISRITEHLERTNKRVIHFKKLMLKLKLSKRMFYPRLNIIKKLYPKSKNFRWDIKRGKFVKK